jgi:hypothetical protein
VHVSGAIADPVPGAQVNSVQYSVVDSEAGGQILNGPVALVNGQYSFVVRLQARRAGQDFNGRQYAINNNTTDTANNVNSHSAVVTVPHDQGHRRFGFGDGGNRGGGHLRIGPPLHNGNGPAHGPASRHGPGHNRGDDFFNNQGDDSGPGNGHGHGNGNGHVNQGNGESGHDQGNGNDNGNGNGNGHGNHGNH